MVSIYSYGMSKGYRDFWNTTSLDYLTGRRQYQNTQKSNQAEIDYLNYQKQAYERQYRDWQKNVPNRQIVYPELSYLGAIRGVDTGITRLGYGTDSAYANYVGHMANTAFGMVRGAGLYKVPGRTYRRL